MNRREFLKAGAESAAFVLPLALAGGCCTGSRGGERRLRFGFMTDTHVTPKPASHHKLRKALELFKAKGCELVVNAGDICDHFYPEGYAAYRRTVEEVFADVPRGRRPAELFAYAWHDAYDYHGHPRAAVSADSKAAFREVKDLLGATNEPTDAKTFGGVPFLVFPQFVGFTKDGYYGIDEYERRVAAACAANPGRPVFIVDHVPAYGTVRGSWSWDAGRARVLANYPQVVHLSGHVHGDIANGLFFWQGGFTEINAGDLFPSDDVWGVVTVDVFDDRLEARRWDIRTGEEMLPDPRWDVRLPYDPASARRFDYGMFGTLRWDSGVLDREIPFAPGRPGALNLPAELFAAKPGTAFFVVLDASSTVADEDRGIFSLALFGRDAGPDARPVRSCTSPSGRSGEMTYIFDFKRTVGAKRPWATSLGFRFTSGSLAGSLTVRRIRVYSKELRPV